MVRIPLVEQAIRDVAIALERRKRLKDRLSALVAGNGVLRFECRVIPGADLEGRSTGRGPDESDSSFAGLRVSLPRHPPAKPIEKGYPRASGLDPDWVLGFAQRLTGPLRRQTIPRNPPTESTKCIYTKRFQGIRPQSPQSVYIKDQPSWPIYVSSCIHETYDLAAPRKRTTVVLESLLFFWPRPVRPSQ
jgi:hypothetical protein